ncbi:G-rich domain on putative tyrosine kinase [Meinhardsimonia xiamenensis]|jgi:uncharacterized protein involved in exopolysaccharide biosynthesis/Mrp family chromosome partitioning ATPase|uniref:G-rich domain on putative tyrosine kinase n=1 Tax=Meinhardsimonia xiamenensis TaxID=990712 RepID=A0A1G8Y2Q9_9RHOB|nr:Wzz/FepE/Etk N-terminal domain-containing protein [Meinhardsimonia xiamenensis]PRX37145.1 putative tyrosine kinase-like protein [Meinhardsimonia xiamenensis]SDJ97149.1 G-rich domain on putative tyrosine kinase [Meinhardsimonia xiamenensis]
MNAPLAGPGAAVFELLRNAERSAAAPPGDLIDFARMFRTLRRGWAMLAALTLLAAAAAGLWAAFLATPQYRSTATLIMAPELVGPTTGLTGVVPGLMGDSVAVNTEVEILQSRALMRQLVEEMRLTSDPEFNPALWPPSVPARLLDAVSARLGLAPLTAPPGPEEAFPRTVDVVSDRIAVRSVPDSRIFEVTAESADPVKAARLANTLARLYLARQVAQKRQEAVEATAWLSERVAELRRELEAADRRARRFAAEMDLVTPEALQGLALQLEEIRQRIGARQAELLRNGTAPGRVRALLQPMREMEEELARRIARHSEGLVQLGQLQLDAEASRVIYEHFLGRLKEAEVQRGVQTPESRILSLAEVPVLPAWPQPVVMAALAGFLGCIAAIALLLWREAGRKGCVSPEELEDASGCRAVGSLPRLAGKDAAEAGTSLGRRPASQAAEAVRNLRSRLFVEAANPPQVLLVTSALNEDGKAPVAGALARSLVDLKRRVLVIDADIKRRGRRLLARKPAPGLVAVLEGKCPLRRAVVSAGTGGFDLLRSEAARANAADLLSSPQLDTLLRAARRDYDCVIVLGAPVLAGPDARLLLRLVDATLLVVAWNRTPRAHIATAVRALRGTGHAPVLAVLSGVSRRLASG